MDRATKISVHQTGFEPILIPSFFYNVSLYKKNRGRYTSLRISPPLTPNIFGQMKRMSSATTTKRTQRKTTLQIRLPFPHAYTLGSSVFSVFVIRNSENMYYCLENILDINTFVNYRKLRMTTKLEEGGVLRL